MSDLTVLIAVIVGGLVLIGIVALMLHRAWGNFPGSITPPPPSMPSTPPEPAHFGSVWDAPDPAVAPELPPGAPAGGLILVKHPLVKRTIDQALDRGGSPYATYFIRDGDAIYLNLDRIADPVQRLRMAETFRTINEEGTGNMSLPELLRAVQEFSKLR